MGTEWIEKHIGNEHWTENLDPWIILPIFPVMVVDFGHINWTTCSIVSSFADGTKNMAAWTIFTKLLIQCVWGYGSRTCVLSNSLDASDNQQFGNLSFRVTAADAGREEAIKGHQMDSDFVFLPLWMDKHFQLNNNEDVCRKDICSLFVFVFSQ